MPNLSLLFQPIFLKLFLIICLCVLGWTVKSLIYNFVQGLILIFDRGLRSGDRICFNGVNCTIIKTGPFNTTLEMDNGQILKLANTELNATKTLNNLTNNLSGLCGVRLRISKAHSTEKFTEICRAVYLKLDHVGVGYKKEIKIRTLESDGDYQVLLISFWVKNPDQHEAAIAEFLVQLHESTKDQGLEFHEDIAKPISFFSAMRHPNFRFYSIALMVSQSGTYMQMLATGWLIYRLTNSALWCGVSVFASQIPSLFLTPYAGVLADRVDNKKWITITQALLAAQAFILAALCLTGNITLIEIIILNLFMGFIESIDLTFRHTFMNQLVEDQNDMGSAVAIITAVDTTAALVGPGVAGTIIVYFSEGACFFINGLSYLLILVGFILMKVKPSHPQGKSQNFVQSFKAGLYYIRQNSCIYYILIYFVALNLFVNQIRTIFPAIVQTYSSLGAKGVSDLSIAAAVGSISGVIFFASRRTTPTFGKWMAAMGVLTGAAYVLVYIFNGFIFIMGETFVASLLQTALFSMGITMIQRVCDDEKRGRVVSFLMIVFLGIPPIGGLLTGWLAEKLGISSTFLIEGVICIFISTLFFKVSSSVNQTLRNALNS